MGIRIQRILGYGLTDLAAEDEDERINWDSWLLTGEGVPTLADYLAWLEKREADPPWPTLDQLCLRDHREPKADLYDCRAYSREFGLPEVLVLRPFGQCDWYRYDDPIDYVQETWLTSQPQTSHVEVIPAGLYPWVGYMDDRTGKTLPAAIMHWVRARNGNRPPHVLETFAKAAGLSGHEEAQAHVVPEVPQEVCDIAAFAALFTDDTVWRQLRPVLYTYWS